MRSADIAKAHILLDGVRIEGGPAALDLIITAGGVLALALAVLSSLGVYALLRPPGPHKT